MPHLHRFHVSADYVSGDACVLPEAEAHHAARVLRLRPGDPVALFDGAGREWTGSVSECDKRRVTVAVSTCREMPPPPRPVTLIQAYLTKDKAIEDIVRRGVELGVNRFIFFHAERSGRVKSRRDKWERLAIECCKQCGRLWLPEFVEADDLAAALYLATDPVLLFTLSDATQPLLDAIRDGAPSLLIGPEGDFTPAEEALALERGAIPVSLGKHTLRSEAAAATAITLVQYELGELGPR